jgi:hypothetical protein
LVDPHSLRLRLRATRHPACQQQHDQPAQPRA